MPRAPQLGRWILRWMYPAEYRENIEGDLEELFARRLAQGSRWRARWLYYKDLASLCRTGFVSPRKPANPGHPNQGIGGDGLMNNLLQDLRYGLRLLVKQPGFTVVAVLTLALGIGANTAIFSVVHGVLLRPLPYREPNRLVSVFETIPVADRMPVSPGNFSDWRDKNQVFAGIAAVASRGYTLTGTGEPEKVSGAAVSPEFFSVLGVHPLHGRGLVAGDDAPGNERVVVLSYGLWQRRFGGDPDLVGQTITLDGNPYTVVGVMPARFQYRLWRSLRALWTPLVLHKNVRHHRHLQVVARLKPGLSLAQAQAGMDPLARQLEQEYPEWNKDRGVNLIRLHDAAVYGVRSRLWMLLGVVGFVLLIACANLANLLLARGATREKEIAIRAAIGAGRRRLVRQLVTESLLLAAWGGALGTLLAWGGVKLFIVHSPPHFPRLDSISVDTTVLAFTLGLTLFTGIVFGLAPALHSSQPDLNQVLKEGMRTGGGRRLLGVPVLRNALVAGGVGLALVLLVGAGLLVRSFWLLISQDTGFRPENLLTVHINLPNYKYAEAPQQRQFFTDLVRQARSLPGTRSVAAINALPFSGWSWGWTIKLTPEDKGSDGASYRVVTPGYFRTLEIPLVSGRTFTVQDTEGAEPVAVVNQAFARHYFPGSDAVGREIWMGARPMQRSTIVGVVGDARYSGLDRDPWRAVYRPLDQSLMPTMMLVVRTDGDPTQLVGALRSQVRALDPDQPITKISTMTGLISDSVAQPRFYMLLLTLFAALAAVLAAVGVYGVMAYAVSRRTHEIGVRMALGAQSSDILKMVVGRGLLLTLVGVGIGLAGAFAATRVLQSLLFGITATDATTFVGTAALVIAVALLASYLPARRATKVDPLVALRYE